MLCYYGDHWSHLELKDDECGVNGENLTQLCVGQMTMAPHEKSITKPEHIHMRKLLLFALTPSGSMLNQLHKMATCQTYIKNVMQTYTNQKTAYRMKERIQISQVLSFPIGSLYIRSKSLTSLYNCLYEPALYYTWTLYLSFW